LGLAVILVRAGWAVGGAVAAIALGAVFPYLLSFYPLRFLWFYKNGEKNVDWRGFIGYTVPVLVATLGLTSLYSVDIILARHFLPSLESGWYAALATMGKVVFFASGIIPTVMFPLVAERHEKKERYQGIIHQSILLVAGESLLVTFGYFIFPELMINFLYGSEYVVAAPFLGWFAVFISFYSLNNLLVNFFLSVGRVKMSWLPLVAAGLQAGLIWLFHQSINQIIRVSLGVSVLLLVVLLVCYKQNDKKRE
jgi:O-antigen/teichoic acid export membrane protein